MNLTAPERRDWLLLLAGSLVVFSTVRVARTGFDWLTRLGYARAMQWGAALALVVVGLAVLVWLAWVARERRPQVYAQLAALAAVYVWAALKLSPMPIERIHLLEYGGLGWLAYRALRHRFAGVDLLWLAALTTLNIGLVDELIQGALPGRFYDAKDVAVNGLSGVLAVLALALLDRARHEKGVP